MAFLTLFVACALFSIALARSTELQLKAIKADFQNAQLVPAPIPVFEPIALLDANFQGLGSITPGQLVSKDEVATAPKLTLTPANSSVSFNGNYTVAMVVNDDRGSGQMRHWLINGAKITDNKVTFKGATTITEYVGPNPPANSGPHSYVIVVYAQGKDFVPPQNLSGPVPGVQPFDFPSYVKNTNLGPLIAGNYFTVEQGNANVSIPATSPVVTSTLPAAKPTHTGTGYNTGSV